VLARRPGPEMLSKPGCASRGRRYTVPHNCWVLHRTACNLHTFGMVHRERKWQRSWLCSVYNKVQDGLMGMGIWWVGVCVSLTRAHTTMRTKDSRKKKQTYSIC